MAINMNKMSILITGGAGNLAHQFLPLLCSGSVFGENTEIYLNLFDIESELNKLKGLVYELQDSNFSLLKKINYGCDPSVLFKDVDLAIFMGAQQRLPGMERSELLQLNCQIYQKQGQYLNQYAKKDCKIVVVANPVNLNCLILLNNCPNIPKTNFTCLMRLDDNRAKNLIAQKCDCDTNQVKKIIIWGNHSLTIYPDLQFCEVDNESVLNVIKDEDFLANQFQEIIKNRGKEIMNLKKTTSILSGAIALKQHLRDWYVGTKNNDFFSMGVYTDGSFYDIPEGLIFSLPVRCKNFQYEIVKDLKLNEEQQKQIQKNVKELINERQEFFDSDQQ